MSVLQVSYGFFFVWLRDSIIGRWQEKGNRNRRRLFVRNARIRITTFFSCHSSSSFSFIHNSLYCCSQSIKGAAERRYCVALRCICIPDQGRSSEEESSAERWMKEPNTAIDSFISLKFHYRNRDKPMNGEWISIEITIIMILLNFCSALQSLANHVSFGLNSFSSSFQNF